MRAALIILFACSSLLAFGQKERLSFQTISSVGLIAGESNAKPVLQFTGGAAYKNYSGGLGLGLDYYRFRSVPLFVDLRMNFGKQQLWFAYAKGGYNFPYHVKTENEWAKSRDEFSGGVYSDIGIGVKLLSFQRHSLLLDAGFSYKEIQNTIGYVYPCFMAPCPEQIYKRNYELGRVTAKLSWRFKN